jgi:hypothetical protein
MRIGSVTFIFIAFTFSFCGSQKSEWKNDLSKINRDSLFQNDYEGWELSTKEEYPNSVLYNIRKKDADTTKVLSFFKSGSGLSVKEYLKYYPEGNGDTCYLKMVSSDTLYFYRQNGGMKNFIVGEYGYRYTSMLLEDYELDYYLKHEDSLRQVRGNNLPKLPKE